MSDGDVVRISVCIRPGQCVMLKLTARYTYAFLNIWTPTVSWVETINVTVKHFYYITENKT